MLCNSMFISAASLNAALIFFVSLMSNYIVRWLVFLYFTNVILWHWHLGKIWKFNSGQRLLKVAIKDASAAEKVSVELYQEMQWMLHAPFKWHWAMQGPRCWYVDDNKYISTPRCGGWGHLEKVTWVQKIWGRYQRILGGKKWRSHCQSWGICLWDESISQQE